MTEIIKYVCDYCGEEFEDEEECLAHEREELMKTVFNDIFMADRYGEPITEKAFNGGDIFYVVLKTVDAARVFNKELEEQGFETIKHDTGATTGKFYFDEEGDCWCTFERLEEKYLETKNVFEQAE